MKRFIAAAFFSLLAAHSVQAADSGNTVNPTWTGSSDNTKRIDAGEAFDLVIVCAADIDAFIKDGKLVRGSRVDIASTGVGMAVDDRCGCRVVV